MTTLSRLFVVCGATTLLAAPAAAQFGNLDLRGMTVALSVDAPMGKFDELAKTGYGIAIRSGVGSTGEAWSGRSSFSFDRFSGYTTYKSIQFITLGFDIIHRSRESFYQFGGVGLYNTRFDYNGSGTAFENRRSEGNFGLTGGVGVNFGSGEGLKGFVEFAATTVFTSGSNSAWFPIRVGVRF